MKILFRFLIFIVGFLLIFPMASFSEQFDAPYYAFEKRNKDAWEKQDKQIDDKLAALEKEFGKKPNIIYILTPALHKKLIFYYPLITLLFATRRENAVDPGGLLGWRSLSESIHPEGG